MDIRTQTTFVRAPEHDRRIRRGDDYAADAWRNTKTGELVQVAVGHKPNGEDK